jgi:hypothetical protein
MAALTHEHGRQSRDVPPASPSRAGLPALSDAEREFWRRAVASERARQSHARPAPFPFQEF